MANPLGTHDDFAGPSGRSSGYGEILGGAPETDEQMMIVRVDGGRAPREVGQNVYGVVPNPPRRIVALAAGVVP